MKLSEFKKNSVPENINGSQENLNKLKDLEYILDVVKNFNSSLDLDEVLALVLIHAIELTQSERGFIVLVNQNGELEYKLGLDHRGMKLPEKLFKISTTVVEDVYKTKRSRFIEGAANNKEFKSSKSIISLELETILCSPLITKNKNIGVIYVDSKKLKKIRSKEISFTFEILAGQAAAAIKNAKIYGELEEAKKKAEASDKLKLAFLGQMSHEIRTPLNSILSFSNLVKENVQNVVKDDLLEGLDIIDRAGHRIIRTFDLLLNMSEVITGTYECAFKKFDLFDSVLRSVYSEFKLEAAEKNIDFVLNKFAGNSNIIADEYTVTQIFKNLVDNAIKFTNEGKIEIKVKENSNTGEILAEVHDTGIGITKEYLSRLFTPFTQEEHGYTRKFEGNGLGLSLVKSYAEMNNAEVSVISEKGRGSVFTVTFKQSL